MSIWRDLLGTAAETAGAAASGPVAPVATAVSDVSHLAENVIERIFGETESKTLDREQARQIILDGFDQARLMGQIEVNKIEASSSSVFVAGWRPAIGWVCASGLFFATTFAFMITMLMWAHFCIKNDVMEPVPTLDIGLLVALLTSLLGMSTLRTVEKKSEVARGKI